jgi:hypothetical protein
MNKATVTYIVSDTVRTGMYTAETVTYQLFDGGRLQLRLARDGVVYRSISFRRAESVDVDTDPTITDRSPDDE